MTLSVVSIVLGLITLVYSADKFIEGAAAVASHLKIRPLIIGLIILGFGTSAPEILVSIFSSLEQKPSLAMGNAVGSNIANIALVLGATAFIANAHIHSSVLKREFPLLLLATIIAGALLLDLDLSRFDSFVLLAFLAAVLVWMVYTGRHASHDHLEEEVEKEIPHIPLKRAWVIVILGLIILMASSKALVWGATNIAHSLGVSELVIGLTIVAVGTSLPELAAGIAAALKGEDDMAIGNIIGSNLFNLLAVIGISGVILPYQIDAIVLKRDFLIMSILTVFVYAIAMFDKQVVSRYHGVILLVCFVSYLCLIYAQTIG